MTTMTTVVITQSLPNFIITVHIAADWNGATTFVNMAMQRCSNIGQEVFYYEWIVFVIIFCFNTNEVQWSATT